MGKLPRFDTEFFNMPTGRAEDYLMENLQDSLKSADNMEDEELRLARIPRRLGNHTEQANRRCGHGHGLRRLWER